MLFLQKSKENCVKIFKFFYIIFELSISEIPKVWCAHLWRCMGAWDIEGGARSKSLGTAHLFGLSPHTLTYENKKLRWL